MKHFEVNQGGEKDEERMLSAGDGVCELERILMAGITREELSAISSDDSLELAFRLAARREAVLREIDILRTRGQAAEGERGGTFNG